MPYTRGKRYGEGRLKPEHHEVALLKLILYKLAHSWDKKFLSPESHLSQTHPFFKPLKLHQNIMHFDYPGINLLPFSYSIGAYPHFI